MAAGIFERDDEAHVYPFCTYVLRSLDLTNQASPAVDVTCYSDIIVCGQSNSIKATVSVCLSVCLS
jgi:hypothetical protein